ncbi:MAG: methylated-DNA--[protein]-cysteine S-methyltransferase [Burkholderiales bacterium]
MPAPDILGHTRKMNSLLESYQAKIAAPFAVLGIREIGEVLTDIEYLPSGAAPLKPQTRFAREVCRQLGAYLKDANFNFDLPCEIYGTVFQKRVWQSVRAIPAGSVLSYSEVARKIQSAPRPVGSACGANRIPILIPCHRVVASQGIGGFMHARSGSPIAIKRWLLNHENPGRYR